MLSEAERDVLNSALEKYRPEQSDPILVGGLSLKHSILQAKLDLAIPIKWHTSKARVQAFRPRFLRALNEEVPRVMDRHSSGCLLSGRFPTRI